MYVCACVVCAVVFFVGVHAWVWLRLDLRARMARVVGSRRAYVHSPFPSLCSPSPVLRVLDLYVLKACPCVVGVRRYVCLCLLVSLCVFVFLCVVVVLVGCVHGGGGGLFGVSVGYET